MSVDRARLRELLDPATHDLSVDRWLGETDDDYAERVRLIGIKAGRSRECSQGKHFWACRGASWCDRACTCHYALDLAAESLPDLLDECDRLEADRDAAVAGMLSAERGPRWP